MSMTQLNTRIEAATKAQGDAVLLRNGYTPSQAVRALWTHIAQTQHVPPFMEPKDENRPADSSSIAQRGFGLATALAQEAGLIASHAGDAPYPQLEDEVYDELLDEYEANHV